VFVTVTVNPKNVAVPHFLRQASLSHLQMMFFTAYGVKNHDYLRRLVDKTTCGAGLKRRIAWLSKVHPEWIEAWHRLRQNNAWRDYLNLGQKLSCRLALR
jgi:site-specific recombinase XerC